MLSELHQDSLTLTLASLSWPHWQAGIARRITPWGQRVGEGRVSFYYWRQGPGVLLVEGHPEITLQPGDVVLLPNASCHSLRDRVNSSDQPIDRVLAQLQSLETNGVASEGSSFVYGYLPIGELGFNPLEGKLPSVLHLPADLAGGVTAAEWQGLLELIDQEHHHRRPGWQAIVRQLVRVLFHQVLRMHLLRNEPRNGETSVRSEDGNAMEPAIKLVVGLLHAELGKPWTVTSLAKWIHMSRSAFSARFREVVGQPPLQYLTEVRMQRACELLVDSDLGIKQIATAVGYESPSSFTNAFKRWRGVSPIAYRMAATNGTTAHSDAPIAHSSS